MTHEFSIGSLTTMLIDLMRGKRKINYREYIRSREWRLKADSAKRRAGYRCQVCNGTKRLQAHHRHYHTLGNERPEDITVLCDSCHELFSKNKKAKNV